jgi:DNA polymerase-3 subunit delta
LYSKGLGEEIREDALAPGYFFYGEESYFADLFIRDLVSLLAPGDAPDFQIDRYYLDETGWGEIIDTARTMPFLFSPWRVIVVRAPERKPDADKSGEKEAKLVSEADEKLLKRYFADPSSRTALVIILPGKLRKGNAAVRVLSSLPGIVAKDAKPLKDWRIGKWVTEKARSLGKAPGQRAREACDIRGRGEDHLRQGRRRSDRLDPGFRPLRARQRPGGGRPPQVPSRA